MHEVRLYMAQRLSALVMAPFVMIHLGVMIYAVQGGLSSEEILGRTRGSVGWMLFYGGFVIMAAIHATIGIRTVARETLRIKGSVVDGLSLCFAAILLFLGMTAVRAVTLAS